jgi:hypothetical protein
MTHNQPTIKFTHMGFKILCTCFFLVINGHLNDQREHQCNIFRKLEDINNKLRKLEDIDRNIKYKQ